MLNSRTKQSRNIDINASLQKQNQSLNQNSNKGINSKVDFYIKNNFNQQSQHILRLLQQKLKIIIQNNLLPTSYFQQIKKAIFNNSKQFQDDQSQNFKQKSQYIQYQYQKQISKLENDTSYGQKIGFLIEQRAQILKQLKNSLIKQKLSNSNANSNKKSTMNLSYVAQNISKLRDIALRIIQHLALWKSWLNSQQSDQYSRQVLTHITNDSQFLRLTPLRKFLQFSSTSDPLFLHSLKKFRKLQLSTNYNARPILNLFQINDQYQKRLINSQKFLKTFLPTQITRNFPMQAYQKQQTPDQIEQQIQASQNTTPINKRHSNFNLPSISKNQNLSLSRNKNKLTSDRFRRGQQQSKIAKLLKPLIDELKIRKNTKKIRDSANSYHTPDKSNADIEFKIKSYTVNKYDEFLKQASPSMSLKNQDHPHHKKYRLMTQTHYKNVDSIQQKLERIGMEGKPKNLKKAKKINNPSLIQNRANTEDIFMQNQVGPGNQIEYQNLQQESNMPNKNTDKNISSIKTIKISSLNKRNQVYGSPKQMIEYKGVKTQNVRNNKQLLPNLKHDTKNIHGMQKYFQTQTSQIQNQIQDEQSKDNNQNQGRNNKIKYKNSNQQILDKQQQKNKLLQKALQRYEKLQNQNYSMPIYNKRTNKHNDSSLRKDKGYHQVKGTNQMFPINKQKQQNYSKGNNSLELKLRKLPKQFINQFGWKQKISHNKKNPYEQIPTLVKKQMIKNNNKYQSPQNRNKFKSYMVSKKNSKHRNLKLQDYQLNHKNQIKILQRQRQRVSKQQIDELQNQKINKINNQNPNKLNKKVKSFSQRQNFEGNQNTNKISTQRQREVGRIKSNNVTPQKNQFNDQKYKKIKKLKTTQKNPYNSSDQFTQNNKKSRRDNNYNHIPQQVPNHKDKIQQLNINNKKNKYQQTQAQKIYNYKSNNVDKNNYITSSNRSKDQNKNINDNSKQQFKNQKQKIQYLQRRLQNQQNLKQKQKYNINEENNNYKHQLNNQNQIHAIKPIISQNKDKLQNNQIDKNNIQKNTIFNQNKDKNQYDNIKNQNESIMKNINQQSFKTIQVNNQSDYRNINKIPIKQSNSNPISKYNQKVNKPQESINLNNPKSQQFNKQFLPMSGDSDKILKNQNKNYNNPSNLNNLSPSSLINNNKNKQLKLETIRQYQNDNENQTYRSFTKQQQNQQHQANPINKTNQPNSNTQYPKQAINNNKNQQIKTNLITNNQFKQANKISQNPLIGNKITNLSPNKSNQIPKNLTNEKMNDNNNNNSASNNNNNNNQLQNNYNKYPNNFNQKNISNSEINPKVLNKGISKQSQNQLNSKNIKIDNNNQNVNSNNASTKVQSNNQNVINKINTNIQNKNNEIINSNNPNNNNIKNDVKNDKTIIVNNDKPNKQVNQNGSYFSDINKNIDNNKIPNPINSLNNLNIQPTNNNNNTDNPKNNNMNNSQIIKDTKINNSNIISYNNNNNNNNQKLNNNNNNVNNQKNNNINNPTNMIINSKTNNIQSINNNKNIQPIKSNINSQNNNLTTNISNSLIQVNKQKQIVNKNDNNMIKNNNQTNKLQIQNTNNINNNPINQNQINKTNTNINSLNPNQNSTYHNINNNNNANIPNNGTINNNNNNNNATNNNNPNLNNNNNPNISNIKNSNQNDKLKTNINNNNNNAVNQNINIKDNQFINQSNKNNNHLNKNNIGNQTNIKANPQKLNINNTNNLNNNTNNNTKQQNTNIKQSANNSKIIQINNKNDKDNIQSSSNNPKDIFTNINSNNQHNNNNLNSNPKNINSNLNLNPNNNTNFKVQNNNNSKIQQPLRTQNNNIINKIQSLSNNQHYNKNYNSQNKDNKNNNIINNQINQPNNLNNNSNNNITEIKTSKNNNITNSSIKNNNNNLEIQNKIVDKLQTNQDKNINLLTNQPKKQSILTNPQLSSTSISNQQQIKSTNFLNSNTNNPPLINPNNNNIVTSTNNTTTTANNPPIISTNIPSITTQNNSNINKPSNNLTNNNSSSTPNVVLSNQKLSNDQNQKINTNIVNNNSLTTIQKPLSNITQNKSNNINNTINQPLNTTKANNNTNLQTTGLKSQTNLDNKNLLNTDNKSTLIVDNKKNQTLPSLSSQIKQIKKGLQKPLTTTNQKQQKISQQKISQNNLIKPKLQQQKTNKIQPNKPILTNPELKQNKQKTQQLNTNGIINLSNLSNLSAQKSLKQSGKQPNTLQNSNISQSNLNSSNKSINSNEIINGNQKIQLQSLTKCIFQSRSLNKTQLSKFLLSHNINKQIISQIQQKYFSHRHLNLNLCWLNNQIISCVLSHPTFSFNQRIIVVVLFKILSKKYLQFSTKLCATTIRYLFFNDPCQSIICMKLRPQYEDECDKLIQKSFVKQIKNIKGRMANIFIQKSSKNIFDRSQSPNNQKQSVYEDKAYLIERKQLPCKNDEAYLNTIQLQINIIGKPNIKLPQKLGKLTLSQSNKSAIEKCFSQSNTNQNAIKKFNSKQKLIEYLKGQQIESLYNNSAIKSMNQNQKQLIFYQRLLCNLDPGIKYTSYCGIYYFLLQQNKSWYWEKNNVGFLFLKCQTKNLIQQNNKNSQIRNLSSPALSNTSKLSGSQTDKNKSLQFFYIFADFVYQSQQKVDAPALIKQYVQQKPANQILKTPSQFNKKVVTVPCFQSNQVIDNFKNDNYIAHINLNLSWKNYIKGVRSFPQQQILAQYIAPFFFGIVMKDINGNMKFICGKHIQKDQQKTQE